jgi:hypothetical protein
MSSSDFAKGTQKSCGCQRSTLLRQASLTHGMGRHPALAMWRSMLNRCYRPTDRAWHNYGGRGITVCAEWQVSFERFWADMEPTYRPGLTLQRKDIDAGYWADNCIWAKRAQPPHPRPSSIALDTPLGPMTILEASRRTGIGRSTLANRHAKGWDSSVILTKPEKAVALSSKARRSS